MNLTFEGFGRDERVNEDRSQWFTPPDIAWRMVRWAGAISPERILEPSAGSGNIVAACRARWEHAEITACELDPYYVARLRERFAGDAHVHVVECDYRDLQAEAPIFDLVVMNAPYEGGLDGVFLAKAMRESLRVIALQRLAALAGAERHRLAWGRVGDEWRMPGLAIFSSRPVFQAGRCIGNRVDGGSSSTDFCVAKLSRVDVESNHSTEVEWW